VIRGFLSAGSTPRLVPAVEARLLIPRITHWTRDVVPFLIDTGSRWSILHPLDADAIGIDLTTLTDPTLWPAPVTGHGLGGSSQYYPLPAAYGFMLEDGRPQVISERLHIAVPTPVNERLPSILGRDVLRHFRLVIDWPGDEVILESS
jgi:hypothetical protein